MSKDDGKSIRIEGGLTKGMVERDTELPDSCKDLVKYYLDPLHQIEAQLMGSHELAYRRGFQAGREYEQKISIQGLFSETPQNRK